MSLLKATDAPLVPQTATQRVMANFEMVKALRDHIRPHVISIKGKKYLKVDGLKMVGSGLGFVTGEASCEYVPSTSSLPGHWHATVKVFDLSSGTVVGQGLGCVFDNERAWRDKELFAKQGMAKTRAAGRALKGVMSWAFAMLGVEGSFAEEMPEEEPTTAQDAPDEPRRLPAPPKAPARPGASGAPVVRGICSHVEAQESKKGKKYWRIALERPDGGSDWFTSFKAVDGSALIGKSVELQLREEKKPDGSVGHICEDIWDVEEVRF